jgi:hypothetical protein
MISYSGAIPTGSEALIKRFNAVETVRCFIVCNNSGTSQTFSLKFAPRDSDAPLTDNTLRTFYQTNIRVGETLIIELYDIKLGNGEELYGLASGGVNICIMVN